MRSFIKKIIGFHVLAILAIFLIVLAVNYIVKNNGEFKFEKEKTILILGHSHSSYALNDSIINNTINLSASGESYFYNYQKAKKILPDNTHLKTVIIEFTNNQIDSIMDDWIWGYEKMSFYLPFYSPFMEFEDYELLFKNNSTDLVSSYSIATRKNLYRIIRNDYNFIDTNGFGGFEDTKISKIDEMITSNKVVPSISNSHSLSEINLLYLRKMIDLFKANNVNVYLLRSPQHYAYPDTSNESIFKDVLNTKFSDVEFLDFDALKLPNNHYRDPQHLNSKGAKQFSVLLNNLLNEKLLEQPKKQELVDSKIKEFNRKKSIK